MTVGAMLLSDLQGEIVTNRSGSLIVEGGGGTGKTTALMARWRALVDEVGPQRIVVICHDRDGALRFLDRAIEGWSGGVDALPITTWYGYAFDLLGWHGRQPVALSRPEQWAFA